MIVTTTRQLNSLCRRLRSAGSFALDTEFVRERTYFIRLGIVQVATADTEAIVDPRAVDPLSPFFELISSPEVEKVVHAGEQDFMIVFDRTGKPPQNVFDTQIAAALVGYGDQLSYAKLVEKILGVKPTKMETLTDWTARPLTPAQIEYALEDVRHLPSLRDHLGRRLKSLGREGWASEEFRYLEDPATYVPTEPNELYRRIRASRLDGRQLGVLRELAAWREQEAVRRDLPRGWVLRDHVLVDIARQRPSSIEGLRQIRSMKVSELEQGGAAILEAVRRGEAKPVEHPREKEVDHRTRLRVKSLVKLLDAWLHTRAAATKIAPSLLASKEQLRALAEGYLNGHVPEQPVLTGWRRELVGQELLDILSGRLRLQVHPETGKLAGSASDPS